MKIVVDLDNTVTVADTTLPYDEIAPRKDVVEQLRSYKARGFEIVIHTARNMRTYDGNVGKINVNTLPVILAWLQKHDVPHDEVLVGKPWCGQGGFYIDDRAVRPDEFTSMSYDEIQKLIGDK